MIVAEFLWSLVIALIVGAVFAFALRRTGPWEGVLWFFLVLILGTWMLGAFMEPVGPVWAGVAWAPFLGVAVILALIFAAATPADRESRYHPLRGPARSEPGVERAENVGLAIAAFFWILVAAFLIGLFVRYLVVEA